MKRTVSDHAGGFLPPELLEHISGRLMRGGRVVKALPYGGRIMVDRPLPFICVHRSDRDGFESGVDRLVRSQTAYLRASSDPAHAEELGMLIKTVADAASAGSQAFLVLEFWASHPKENPDTFKIFGPLNNAPETAAQLEKGLKGVLPGLLGAKVRSFDSDVRHPPHAGPLLNLDDAKREGILIFGVEIPPVYRSRNGEFAELAFRRIRARFTDAIKRTVHAFARVQTPERFGHHLVLGRTRFTRLALNIDKALARISGSFDLLLNVSPVNTEEAWEEFQKSTYTRKPDLHYRLIAVDPERIKRELYTLRIDDMEDTTLQAIFRSKREELDTQATLMSERGRRNFLYSGLRLYGGVDDAILQKAHGIMREADRKGSSSGGRMNAVDFAHLIRSELDGYAGHFPGVDLTVEIKDDIPGVMVSKGAVLVGQRFSVDAANAHALIQHEVGTHVLTYANGRMQPFQQLHAGMAGYEQLQEGLAVLAEYLSGGLGASRYKLLGGRVVAVHALIHGADFVECFGLLHKEHGFAPRTAFNITTRIYRGGGLPKDAIYLKGLDQLIDHLDGATDGLEIFYTGKFALQHLPLIRDLHHRGVLHEPVMPPYMGMTAKDGLKRLHKGMDLASLLHDHN